MRVIYVLLAAALLIFAAWKYFAYKKYLNNAVRSSGPSVDIDYTAPDQGGASSQGAPSVVTQDQYNQALENARRAREIAAKNGLSVRPV